MKPRVWEKQRHKRQDKTKADREAEKGSHYYRQRVCAVCGSTYWPTHSQQKFCSEECKKVNHNKKTLEFYYKKQKEKELCKDLLQTKEQVSDTNWCCIIKVDTLFSRILIYNHNQYENRRKTYGTESKIL